MQYKHLGQAEQLQLQRLGRGDMWRKPGHLLSSLQTLAAHGLITIRQPYRSTAVVHVTITEAGIQCLAQRQPYTRAKRAR